MRAFLGEHCPHAAVAIFRAAAQARFLQAPRGCLGVQITDIFELAGSKKSVASKTYRSFHAPFTVGRQLQVIRTLKRRSLLGSRILFTRCAGRSSFSRRARIIGAKIG